MSPLVESLRQFNRKERYWLLRNALGAPIERLDSTFSKALGKAIGIQIPEDAWWAIDFHLDWLIGALFTYQGGQTNYPRPNVSQAVRGTHEDIDLIIAFDHTLILIEAKAGTSWSNLQLNSKVGRLSDIFDETLLSTLTLKFVLMSPKKSSGLKRHRGWPDWMVDSTKQPIHFELKMGDGQPFIRVTRCDEFGKTSAVGDHWILT